jgi:hypothetical protein
MCNASMSSKSTNLVPSVANIVLEAYSLMSKEFIVYLCLSLLASVLFIGNYYI